MIISLNGIILLRKISLSKIYIFLTKISVISYDPPQLKFSLSKSDGFIGLGRETSISARKVLQHNFE